MSGPEVTWLTVFLDIPAQRTAPAIDFWQEVTGYGLSAWRGHKVEFATFVPPGGDAYLRVQRTQSGAGGFHLDLHTEDPERLEAVALSLGARRHDCAGPVRALVSPGGMAFCAVSSETTQAHEPNAGITGQPGRPPPARWPTGHTSMVDQLCLDVPGTSFGTECKFWAMLTGWDLRPGALPEFSYLGRPSELPVRLLFQRLGAPAPGSSQRDCAAVSAHLDLATTDVSAEVLRHENFGASIWENHRLWTTMQAPTGELYCITSRDPTTGTLMGTVP
ncbi:MAG TPA: VOC family protein [Acidimicrobiales bacterium]|nr:VOC family protein [Acidimicrobiales bacterium]